MKKSIWLLTGFAALGTLVLAGCFSLGPVRVKTYEMTVMPAPDALQGKKAVVFDLAMAEKVLPKRATGTTGGGGLVGAAIAAAGNAADLANFKKAASGESWLEQERAALVKKQPSIYEAFAARYTELNNADTVRAAFDFDGLTPAADYFGKADAALQTKIMAICAESEADFAVTMVGQIVHDETMNAAPISAPTRIIVEVCLFDNTGSLVSRGKVQTVNILTRPADFITPYNMLLDDACENMVLMLPALDGNGEKIGTKEIK